MEKPKVSILSEKKSNLKNWRILKKIFIIKLKTLHIAFITSVFSSFGLFICILNIL